MSNKSYDALKQAVLIIIPALATLFSSLGLIIPNFPGETIAAVIMAIGLFLGSVVSWIGHVYQKNTGVGVMEVEETEEGGLVYSLDLETDPEQLRDQDRVVFKVRNV